MSNPGVSPTDSLQGRKVVGMAKTAMRSIRHARMIPWAAVHAVLLLGSLPNVVGDVQEPAGPETVAGITAPIRQATLSAIQPGRLACIVAAEGSTVRAGELVFSLDDGGQEARAQMAEAEAASTLDIELTEARWEQARRDLNRIQRIAEASGQDFATQKELADAQSTERIRGVELRIARFVHGQNQLAARRERRTLEQFHVYAPFDGYIAQYVKEQGETVNENEGVVTLARLDPLMVPLDCPLHLAPRVRVGDRVRVRPTDPRWPERDGAVAFASRIGDGGSQTFRVKVTVDNTDGAWMAGMKVTVEFGSVKRSADQRAGSTGVNAGIP